MAERAWTTLQLVHAHSPVLFAARNPFPPGGVVKGPANGAAAAAFGGYLRALGLVDVPAQVTVLQGEDMGRPSRLLIDITNDDRYVPPAAPQRSPTRKATVNPFAQPGSTGVVGVLGMS